MKLTKVGWALCATVLLGALVGLASEYQSERLKDIAASPVYSRLSSVAHFARQNSLVKRFAEDPADPRHKVALQFAAIEELEDSIDFSCRDFSDSWDRWGIETDPRVRFELEMVDYLCERSSTKTIDILRDAANLAQRRICDLTLHHQSCQPDSLDEIEDDLNSTFFLEVYKDDEE